MCLHSFARKLTNQLKPLESKKEGPIVEPSFLLSTEVLRPSAKISPLLFDSRLCSMTSFLAGFSISGKVLPSPRMAAACECTVVRVTPSPPNVRRAINFEPVLIFWR